MENDNVDEDDNDDDNEDETMTMTQPDLVSKLREFSEALCDCEGTRLNGRARELANEMREFLLGLEGQAAPSVPELCPSCQAADNNPYTDSHGQQMRACGRCMIQWVARSAQTCGPSQPETEGEAGRQPVGPNSPSEQPSPSTPIVPGTAGLSAKEAAQHDELYVGDELDQLAEDIERDGFMGGPGRLSAKQVQQAYYGNPGWQHVADRLNALLGAAKPVGISIDALEDLMQQFKQREAQIRKDVLEEAAQHFDCHENGCPISVNGMICTCKKRWPWIGEAIRALAERPAPAGEVKEKSDG